MPTSVAEKLAKHVVPVTFILAPGFGITVMVIASYALHDPLEASIVYVYVPALFTPKKVGWAVVVLLNNVVGVQR